MIENAETKSGSPEPPALVGVIDGPEMNNSIKIGKIQSAIIDFLIQNKVDRVSSVGNVEYREAIKNIVNGYAWLIDLMLSDEETDGVVQGVLEEYEDAFKRQKVEKIIRERDRKLNEIKCLEDGIQDYNKRIIEIKIDQIPEIEKKIAEAENEYNIKIVERKVEDVFNGCDGE